MSTTRQSAKTTRKSRSSRAKATATSTSQTTEATSAMSDPFGPSAFESFERRLREQGTLPPRTSQPLPSVSEPGQGPVFFNTIESEPAPLHTNPQDPPRPEASRLHEEDVQAPRRRKRRKKQRVVTPEDRRKALRDKHAKLLKSRPASRGFIGYDNEQEALEGIETKMWGPKGELRKRMKQYIRRNRPGLRFGQLTAEKKRELARAMARQHFRPQTAFDVQEIQDKVDEIRQVRRNTPADKLVVVKFDETVTGPAGEVSSRAIYRTASDKVLDDLKNIERFELEQITDQITGSDREILDLLVKGEYVMDYEVWDRDRQERASGAFFKWHLQKRFGTSPFQRMGVYCEEDVTKETYLDNCIVNAIKHSGRFSDTRISRVKLMCLGRTIPKHKLEDIAKVLKVPIKLTQLGGAGKRYRNPTNYNKESSEEPLHLGLIADHYFLVEQSPCTVFALKNYDKVKDQPDWQCIISKRGKHWRRDRRKLPQTIAIMRELVNNQEKYLTDITTSRKVLQGYNYDMATEDLKLEETWNRDFSWMGPEIDYTEETKEEEKVEEPQEDEDEEMEEELWDTEGTLIVAFDTETYNHTTHYVNEKGENCTKHEERAYLCSLYDGKKVMTWKGPQCVQNALESLPKDCVMLIHNAGFDLKIVAQQAKIYHYRHINRGTSILSANFKVKNKNKKSIQVKVIDTLSQISEPLSKFGKMFNLKQEKEVMPYGLYTQFNLESEWVHTKDAMYHLYSDKDKEDFRANIKKIGCCTPRGGKFKIWDYAAWYCEQDVRVLWQGYMEFRRLNIELTSIDPITKISAPQIAHSFLKRAGCYEGVCNIGGVAYHFMKRAIKGGVVRSRFNRQWHVRNRIQDYDANSLYPSAMVRLGRLPLGPGYLIKDEDHYRYLRSNPDRYFTVTENEILSVGRRVAMPCIRVKMEDGTIQYTDDPKHVVGYKDVFTNIALEDMENFQGVETRFIRGYWFPRYRADLRPRDRQHPVPYLHQKKWIPGLTLKERMDGDWLKVEKVRCTETIDRQKLNRLLEDMPRQLGGHEIKEEHIDEEGNKVPDGYDALKAFARECDAYGRTRVCYSGKNGYGRLFSEGPSIQRLAKGFREALCQDRTDIDLVCCHPVLLVQIARAQGLELPQWEQYVADVKGTRNQVAKEINGSYKEAKKQLLKVMYGGHAKAPTLKALSDEMKIIYQWIQKAYPQVLEDRKDKSNPKASALSCILGTAESHVMTAVLHKLVELKVENVTMSFDGAVIGVDAETAKALIPQLEKHVKEMTSFEVQLDIKAMDEIEVKPLGKKPPPPSTLAEKIQGLYNARRDYKAEAKRTGEDVNPMQAVIKLQMNSAYGKTIMKEITDNTRFFDTEQAAKKHVMYNNAAVIQMEQVAGKIWSVKKRKSISRHQVPVIVGALILDMSKRIMNEVLFVAEDEGIPVYYQDTDSMHLPLDDIPKLEQAYLKKYGKVLTGEGLGQFSSDFSLKDDQGRKCKDVHSTELIILGKKAYADRVVGTDPDGNKVEGFHFRLKGVRSKSVEVRARQMKTNVMGLYETMLYGANDKGKEIRYNLLVEGGFSPQQVNALAIKRRPTFYRKVSFKRNIAEVSAEDEQRIYSQRA